MNLDETAEKRSEINTEAKHIIVRVEPSKRLSEILGFPYFIEAAFPIEKLKDFLTEEDLLKLESGQEIEKETRISGS